MEAGEMVGYARLFSQLLGFKTPNQHRQIMGMTFFKRQNAG